GFFFSSRRRHTRLVSDWSSDVCSSDLGAIRFAGEAIGGLPAWRRARRGIGYVPQEREIFRSLSAEENLTVAARPGRWTLERVYEIGRAACRGRGEMCGGAGGARRQSSG